MPHSDDVMALSVPPFGGVDDSSQGHNQGGAKEQLHQDAESMIVHATVYFWGEIHGHDNLLPYSCIVIIISPQEETMRLYMYVRCAEQQVAH